VKEQLLSAFQVTSLSEENRFEVADQKHCHLIDTSFRRPGTWSVFVTSVAIKHHR
jgi:hypothetical protein